MRYSVLWQSSKNSRRGTRHCRATAGWPFASASTWGMSSSTANASTEMGSISPPASRDWPRVEGSVLERPYLLQTSEYLQHAFEYCVETGDVARAVDIAVHQFAT